MSDILAPEAVSRIDGFYDTTLKPKLDAIDHQRRQVRWLIIKSLLVVLTPIGILIAGDLLDGIPPFISSTARIVIAWVWLVAGVVFVLMKHLLPGVTAYANYRSRFKEDIVAEIFKVVCPSAIYDPLQGVTKDVFDAPGLFNPRGSFESDDRVRGHIGQTPFEASEVGRGYSTGTGKNSRSYTVFRGLFFHLGLNLRLGGVTLSSSARRGQGSSIASGRSTKRGGPDHRRDGRRHQRQRHEEHRPVEGPGEDGSDRLEPVRRGPQ